MKDHQMRIIGIDPGMAITGYSVLDVDDNENTSRASKATSSTCSSPDSQRFSIVCSGSIQTNKQLDVSSRLLEIHNDLIELVNTYKPDIASIEQLFFFKNAKTIMPVAEARGVIIMTFRMHNIPVYEYTPLVVKQTITGYGRADKDDVKEVIKLMLNNEDIPKLDDTTDAIAIALCHVHQNDFCKSI